MSTTKERPKVIKEDTLNGILKLIEAQLMYQEVIRKVELKLRVAKTKVENTIIIPAGEPGKNGTVTSFCPFNTGLTGGAYRKDPKAVIVNSAPTANNSGWTVSGVNSFPFAVLIY